MRYLRLFVVCALLALGVAACGGSDEGADSAGESATTVNAGNGDGGPTISIETDDGDVEISGSEDDGEFDITYTDDDGEVVISGSEQVPDGFPLPIHSDCTVVAGTTVQATDGGMMTVTVEMPADKAEEIAEFYQEELEDMNMMVIRTAGSDNESSMIFLSGVDNDGADRGASCIFDIQADIATAVISIGGDT